MTDFELTQEAKRIAHEAIQAQELYMQDPEEYINDTCYQYFTYYSECHKLCMECDISEAESLLSLDDEYRSYDKWAFDLINTELRLRALFQLEKMLSRRV